MTPMRSGIIPPQLDTSLQGIRRKRPYLWLEKNQLEPLLPIVHSYLVPPSPIIVPPKQFFLGVFFSTEEVFAYCG